MAIFWPSLRKKFCFSLMFYLVCHLLWVIVILSQCELIKVDHLFCYSFNPHQVVVDLATMRRCGRRDLRTHTSDECNIEQLLDPIPYFIVTHCFLSQRIPRLSSLLPFWHEAAW